MTSGISYVEVIGDLDIDSFDKSLIGERTEGENLDTVSLDNPFNEFCSKEKKRNGKERGLGGGRGCYTNIGRKNNIFVC